jgi:hypothetical protein
LKEAGYSIKLEHVYELAKYNIKINNLDDFNIDVNSPMLYKAIGESGFEPYVSDMKISLSVLQHKCKAGIELSELKTYCKSIKPDAICLLGAITHNTNKRGSSITIVRYLIDNCNITPTIECLNEAINKKASDKIIKMIYDAFEKQYVVDIAELNNYKKNSTKSIVLPTLTEVNSLDSYDSVNYNENNEIKEDIKKHPKIKITIKKTKITNN